MGLIWLLIVGLIAGWLANQIMKKDSGSLPMNLVVGVVGALIGGFLGRLIGLQATGLIGSIIMATIGAVVLLWIVAKVRER
ncbi:GlsB/YeaQ/YmgE family stress response membrane protein [Silicimonas algicola]|uniref:Putative membrane protein YeaQ/YmgE (Transglycosylase-associated protein family) n=1 Tax=Silicimonas algicola TaxID=1826607 RepID=A0A316FZQ6_9RHOB|nr:GlsB/YeaQ/YmgE family stress response membrane protein [Silicimonas algicola]AZQ69078.1 GlsB/YeaQ/YmgE family stress response membrane protein [Silicimonas algicola]PWK54028.1 putative membrane protein YeaQ/YmgE (transglycosylase-associated protein family) [Silicimonas algicola]